MASRSTSSRTDAPERSPGPGGSFNGLPEIHVATREAWRRWLRSNHRRAAGAWLIYAKRHTKRPRIPYRDALEEAICFGWIDALVRSIDGESYAQKWTPRRPGSPWSAINRHIAQTMIDQGRMTKAGLEALGPDPANPPKAPPPIATTGVPKDLAQALRSNPRARAFFETLAPSYRARYLRWIAEAKRDETRKRRIDRVVELLSQGVKASLK